MPHYFELIQSLRDALNKMNVAEIKPRVIFEGKAKVSTGNDAGGFPIFSNTYSQVNVDISDRINLDNPIQIVMEKPIFPDDGGNVLISSNVSLPLVNTDKSFAAIQTGAIIDPDSVEGGIVKIQARIGATNQLLNLFQGRITGLPGEQFKNTTLDLLDNLFDAITTELKYEDFGQNSYVSAGQLITNGFQIIQGDGYIKFHDGYLVYTEDGNLITSFENNKPELIDLLDVRLKSFARLGVYTIEFQSYGGFRVTFPDSTVLTGDISTTFDSPYLTIEPSFWQIAAGQTNFNGTKITFQCRYVVEGNPFSIIKMLLERSFFKNFGDPPSNTTNNTYAGSILPIVWSTLDELETRFRLIRVYISVGNSDNKVFEKKPNGKPLDCIHLSQQIADHCCSNLLIDNNGELRIQGAQIFDTVIYDLTDTHFEGFELVGLIKDNYLTVNYGNCDSGSAYGKKLEFDLRALPETPVQEITINFPFFKVGLSDNHAAYFARIFKKKITQGYVRARGTVPAQFGIAFIPGDRIRVITTKQPIITSYFEIFRVSKSCAFEPVELEMIRIQSPEGIEETPCTFSFCVDELCI